MQVTEIKIQESIVVLLIGFVFPIYFGMQRWLLFLAPLCILFDSCQLFYLVLVILIGCGCLWLYFILYRVCFAFFFKALVSLINQCLLFLIFILLFSFRFEICFGFGIFSVIRIAKVTRQSQSMIIISEKRGSGFRCNSLGARDLLHPILFQVGQRKFEGQSWQVCV